MCEPADLAMLNHCHRSSSQSSFLESSDSRMDALNRTPTLLVILDTLGDCQGFTIHTRAERISEDKTMYALNQLYLRGTFSINARDSANRSRNIAQVSSETCPLRTDSSA